AGMGRDERWQPFPLRGTGGPNATAHYRPRLASGTSEIEPIDVLAPSRRSPMARGIGLQRPDQPSTQAFFRRIKRSAADFGEVAALEQCCESLVSSERFPLRIAGEENEIDV